jgi:dipeptidyl aminopeptidase/acylaminoacyl peptidase
MENKMLSLSLKNMKKIKKVVQAALIIAILIAPSLLIVENRDAFAAATTEQKIVYTQFNIQNPDNDTDETADLIVMNKDGSNKTNITNSPDVGELWPKWSPDGKQIAYIEQTIEGASSLEFGIVVVNDDGTNRRVLNNIQYPGETFDRAVAGFFWTKDGKGILKVSPTSPNTSMVSIFDTESLVETEVGEITVEDGFTTYVRIDYSPEKNYLVVGANSELPSEWTSEGKCSAYIVKLNEGTNLELISENDGRCTTMFFSPSGNKLMQSILDRTEQPGDPIQRSGNIAINDIETFEQDLYVGAGTTYDSNLHSPWSQSEEFIFIADLTQTVSLTFDDMRLLNVADGSIRKVVSIPGTRNYPIGQLIDNDTNILIDVVSAGVSADDPNFFYIGIYNIETGQIVNLTGGDEYLEFYSDISSTTSTDNPELPFVDPATIIPPKTGLTVGVVSGLVGTLSILSLVGYGSAKKISKRSFSGSER